MRQVLFLTHAQVEIDPSVPVPDWPLSARGRARHEGFCGDVALAGVTAIYSSRERKARDGAAIHAAALDLTPVAVTTLHENDRSSTGYLSPDAFERHADAFFARPDESVDGWEPAARASARIVCALRTIFEIDATGGDILVVAHGAVGALLRCDLLGKSITRDEDQPAGGGNVFAFDPKTWSAPTEWRPI
ncbi:MAG: histidine phosphatase family protein [Pseudomonadota bacterium]